LVVVCFTYNVYCLVGDTFTVNCAPLTTQRSDPIVSPGIASAHVHAVIGGNAFRRSMVAANAANLANATTCDKSLDHSNYWVPQLYHQRADGLWEMVHHKGSAVYYQKRTCNYSATATVCDDSVNIPLAFPDGFRMLAGDPLRRTQSYTDFRQTAVNIMCINNGYSKQYQGFPPVTCETMRAEVYFPGCWDGVNVDSPDHQSHVAYPAIGNFDGGVCPKSHPVAIFSIFFEFFFDTSPYTDFNRFAFANGDPTGFGFHGDFIMGWTDRNALQHAHANCISAADCPTLGNKGQTTETLIYPAIYEEEIGLHGPINLLPGFNPVNFSTEYLPRVKIAASNGAFIVSAGNGGPLKAAATVATASIFEMSQVSLPGNVTTFKNLADFEFISADNGGNGQLTADRDGPGGWESFIVTMNSDGTYSILAKADSKYVALQADSSLIANAVTIGATSSFKFLFV